LQEIPGQARDEGRRSRKERQARDEGARMQREDKPAMRVDDPAKRGKPGMRGHACNEFLSQPPPIPPYNNEVGISRANGP